MADYPAKSGLWPQLFYYMERLGCQLDGARLDQVLIMPFMTEARKDGGILITDWQDIFSQILTQVRGIYDPSDQSALSIAQLVVSSFSARMIYSDSFRRHGAPGQPSPTLVPPPRLSPHPQPPPAAPAVPIVAPADATWANSKAAGLLGLSRRCCCHGQYGGGDEPGCVHRNHGDGRRSRRPRRIAPRRQFPTDPASASAGNIADMLDADGGRKGRGET